MTMTNEKMAPKRRKKIPKSRNEALHIEKKAPIRGENPHGFFLQGGESLLSHPPPLLAHMIKSDYKMRNIFVNYLSHNYVKIHSRLHLIELFLKNFLGRAYLKSPRSKIERVIRTARQRKWSVLGLQYYNTSPLFQKLYHHI